MKKLLKIFYFYFIRTNERIKQKVEETRELEKYVNLP
jgi:hypothetical protein